MKIISHITTASILALLACTAHAGSSSGKVTGIFMHTPDIVMFGAGTINGTPSCSSGTQQWAIKLSDPAGKGFLAMLLSAQAQGKSVIVHGYTNTCRDWGDRELPSYIVIVD
jgi:hypothetical protein